MGQFSSKQNSDKEKEEGENDYLKFLSCNIQGWKNLNENTFISKISQGNDNNYDIFCIFEGNNGNEVSNFVKNHFHLELLNNINSSPSRIKEAINKTFLEMNELMKKKEGKDEIINLKISSQQEENKKYKKILNEVIENENIINEELSKDEQDEILDYTGCTAILILIDEKNKKLYFGNIGNSIAIICGKNEQKIFESQHKPTDANEKKRIEETDGFLINEKLYGVLNTTRAFGNFAYIENNQNGNKILSDEPDIKEYNIQSEDEYIFIATESVIECIDKEKIKNIIKENISKPNILDEMLENNIVYDFYNNDTEIGFNNMTGTLIIIKKEDK